MPSLALPNGYVRTVTQVNANLEDTAELLSFTTDRDTYRPGDTVSVTLYWRALRAPQQDYKTFVHLTDVDVTRQPAQHDGDPGGGFSPTTRWLPGELVPDTHHLTLPADLAPGRYRLWAGMYEHEPLRNLADPLLRRADRRQPRAARRDRGSRPMNRQRDRSCLLLAGLLLAFVLLATWYSLIIPLGEAPDEVPHFTYVRYLAQHGRLPTTTEEHEAFQPPLYYALGAALTFWIEDEPDAPFAVRTNAYFDPLDPRAPKNLLLHTGGEAWPYRGWALAWHLVRLLSIALGAVTVWAVYQLGRVLFPDRPAIRLTMAALTAFTPQFLFLSAVVNNDNAATALSALILWQVAALLHDTGRTQLWKRCLLLGVLLGLGVLSKASLIALVPVVALAVLAASSKVQAARRASRSAACCLLLAA